MEMEYICRECNFIWSKDNNEIVRICPNCRSYNIQFKSGLFTKVAVDSTEAESQVNISRKLKIHEYIVPWMIEI
jgi:Zn finger protein HypA/HybF involved in hydrogenase expression